MILNYMIGVAFLLVASLFDLKTREIPDWLSFAFFFTIIASKSIEAIFINSIDPILYSLSGFILFYVIGIIMFYTGQWGGGDSKLLFGLGALIGLENILDPIYFIIILLLAGGIYGLVWTLGLIYKDWKEIKKSAIETIVEFKRHYYSLAIFLITTTIVINLFIKDIFTLIFFLTMSVIIFVSAIILSIVKSVENVSMIKIIPSSKLTEGDWLIEDVYYKNKLIVPQRELGVEREDLELLKKYNVDFVTIKEGIPFVPSFFIAFIVFMVFFVIA